MRVEKRQVTDRFDRILTVFTQRDGECEEKVIGEGHVYHTDLLPGFELPLAILFAMADSWPED